MQEKAQERRERIEDMQVFIASLRNMLVGLLGLHLLHPDAPKLAKEQYEKKKQAEEAAAAAGETAKAPSPASKVPTLPFVPALFILANHHLLQKYWPTIQAATSAGRVGGTAEADAFDELSKAMHDVLRGEMDAEQLGVFQSLVREGDPDSPDFWSTPEAMDQLARLGVQPMHDAPEDADAGPVIQTRDNAPDLAQDALAAFQEALGAEDE